MMHTWNWRTEQDCTYLTCSLLDSWPHGFFTRAAWPRTPVELSPMMHPEADIFRVKQVHGNQVLNPQEAGVYQAATSNHPDLESPTLQEADGLLSHCANQAVWVCTADCTPVLIADSRTGQVAAVHAGWRGTAAKIVPMAISRLQEQGSQLQDLRVAMGPAIAGEVYQVSTEVAAQVGATVVDSDKLLASDDHTDTIPKTLMDYAEPPILADDAPDRVRLDVRRVNAMQLDQLGLALEQIAIAPHCTYQEPEQFFSYRRDNLQKVQWSGIVSRRGKCCKPQIIFLDAVGTLFGVRDTVGSIYGKFAQAAGVEVDPVRLNQVFFESFREAPQAAFPGVDAAEIPAREYDWWLAIARQSFAKAGVLEQFDNFDQFFPQLFDHFAVADPWMVYPEVPQALRKWQHAGLEAGSDLEL